MLADTTNQTATVKFDEHRLVCCLSDLVANFKRIADVSAEYPGGEEGFVYYCDSQEEFAIIEHLFLNQQLPVTEENTTNMLLAGEKLGYNDMRRIFDDVESAHKDKSVFIGKMLEIYNKSYEYSAEIREFINSWMWILICDTRRDILSMLTKIDTVTNLLQKYSLSKSEKFVSAMFDNLTKDKKEYGSKYGVSVLERYLSLVWPSKLGELSEIIPSTKINSDVEKWIKLTIINYIITNFRNDDREMDAVLLLSTQ